jgi:hypothetical protein
MTCFGNVLIGKNTKGMDTKGLFNSVRTTTDTYGFDGSSKDGDLARMAYLSLTRFDGHLGEAWGMGWFS